MSHHQHGYPLPSLATPPYRTLIPVGLKHYMDANETDGEKAWQQLRKNAATNIEQVLEAAPNKAASVRPPTTHHENYQN